MVVHSDTPSESPHTKHHGTVLIVLSIVIVCLDQSPASLKDMYLPKTAYKVDTSSGPSIPARIFM